MRIRLKLDQLELLLSRSQISQNHWAIRLGLSKGHLSSLLAGKYPYPSARTRERMLETLGVPFDALFTIEPGHELPEFAMQRELADHYLIDKQIGQGGMGTVWLARDIRLGRSVAIKIVNDEAVSSVGAGALLKEIIQTNRLQHPNVLSVFDAGEANGSPYYVMPYVRGGSLRDRLKRDERIPVGKVLSILSGLAGALDHAHTLGVLHCDVKPANVLLADDHAYLIDFGIGRVIHSEVWQGKPRGEYDAGAGTPAYVSPEQASGEPNLDPRTDVYSLACMTYEMLAGKQPFEGETTLATVAKRFTEAPPMLHEAAPYLPRELSDAICRGMAVDRNQRTQTAGAFLRDCQRAVAMAGSVVGVPVALRAVPVHSHAHLAERAVDTTMQNFRLALRSIRRAPAMAAAIALTLGLGIGVNAVMFGMIDRLFFRAPAHVVAPDEVRRVFIRTSFLGKNVARSSLSFPDLEDVRKVTSLRSAAGYFPTRLGFDRGRNAISIAAVMTTHDFFPLLGVRPQLGRFFDASEDMPGASGVVVLSDAFWKARFNGDSAVLGRVVPVGSGSYQVVGVAPSGFTGIDLQAVDLFLPLRSAANEAIQGDIEQSRNISWIRVIARLAPGVNTSRAESETFARISAAMASQAGDNSRHDLGVALAPVLNARGPLATLDAKISLWLGAVSVILLIITCANVVNLLLVRHMHREGEFALCSALGASRHRVLAQLAAESIVLSVLAALVGVLLAQWAGALLARFLLPGVPVESLIANGRMMLFTAIVALVGGLLAGLIPAFATSKPDIAGALRLGRGGSHARASRLRSGLLVFQASLSVVLLVGGGLFVQSMNRMRGMDAGLDLDRLMIASVDLSGLRKTPQELAIIQSEAMARIERIPGVVSVTGTNAAPFATNIGISLSIPGRDSLPSVKSGGPYINAVGANYFRNVGTRIVKGRAFTDDDRAGTPRVAVVGETMARMIWPSESALGKCMKVGGDSLPCTEVVGVAQDAPRASLLDRENMQYYVPAAQYQPNVPHSALFVRTSGDPSRVTQVVRRELQSISPELAVAEVRPLWEMAARETRPFKLGATLFSVFGALAMIVASIGLYSVLSFSVARRTREFGIRAAMGATMRDVVTLVLAGGMRLVAIGLVIGFGLALVAGRWIAPLLYHTSPYSLSVFASVGGLLLVSAVLACLLPAWRATKVVPMEALRAE
ncbi:MAG: ADOP family duplicated permease [Gemmatimonadota bacterium]